jgi:hypothetical protein
MTVLQTTCNQWSNCVPLTRPAPAHCVCGALVPGLLGLQTWPLAGRQRLNKAGAVAHKRDVVQELVRARQVAVEAAGTAATAGGAAAAGVCPAWSSVSAVEPGGALKCRVLDVMLVMRLTGGVTYVRHGAFALVSRAERYYCCHKYAA